MINLQQKTLYSKLLFSGIVEYDFQLRTKTGMYIFFSSEITDVYTCLLSYQHTFGPRREKPCLRAFANITGADQPAHPRSLISAFVVRFLESII